MSDLKTIEIDFEIYKRIEAERRSFSEPPYIALRRLLNLPEAQSRASPTNVDVGRSWFAEGVTLPHGTSVRMSYNGRRHEGEIVDGKWVIEGRSFDSPSGAASGVATTKRGRKTRLDGWIYWEVLLPGSEEWKPIAALRSRGAMQELADQGQRLRLGY